MINYMEDRAKFTQALSGSQDILFIDFEIAGRASVLIFIDGMSDKELTDRHIIAPLKGVSSLIEHTYSKQTNFEKFIKQSKI